MSWIHVSSTDLNDTDIFAFVNMKEKIKVKGRLFNKCDSTKGIMAMDDAGGVEELLSLPSWALVQPEEELLRTVLEEIGKLPGADRANKYFNINAGNFSPEQMASLADAVMKKAIEAPSVVILKYVPDLSLTEEMMKEFS